jgi:hypothetical protein
MDLTFLASLYSRWFILPALAVMVLIGLTAFFSPKQFAAISKASSQWVDTQRYWDVLDKRVDVDRVALRHSRLFGLVVVAGALLLAWVYWVYILGNSLPW